MKRLVTPPVGKVRMIGTRTLTGGVDYIVASDKDTEVNNLVGLGFLNFLMTPEGKLVTLPDSASATVFNEIVEETVETRPWDKEVESYSEYCSNIQIFAAEAYTAELEAAEKSEAESAPTTPRRSKKSTAKSEVEQTKEPEQTKENTEG